MTAFYNQSSITSEFFGGVASKAMSLSDSNLLAPSVEIDSKRASALTDTTGIASFGFKITKGLD